MAGLRSRCAGPLVRLKARSIKALLSSIKALLVALNKKVGYGWIEKQEVLY
jgi:hypothetical protein